MNKGRISGIAFSDYDQNLIYVSAYKASTNTSGIYAVNYNTGAIVGIIATGDYGRTNLRKAPDGHIYAMSNDGMNMGQINQTTGQFQSNVLSLPAGYPLGTYRMIDGLQYYILPEEDRTYIEPVLTLNATGAGLCQTNGSITATVTGGIPPYTFTWEVRTGSTWTLVSTYTGTSTTNTLNGVEAGEMYQCTVTDQAGTVVPQTITVPYTSEVTTGLNTWSGPTTNQTRYFSDGFYVPAGQTITLTNCTCYFGNEAKVEVRNGIIDNTTTITTSGGKLVLNNTTFTVAPGCDMWKGVEVWGKERFPQYAMNGKIAQGQLNMTNNSAINNARSAIELWKPGDYTTTGGMVSATGSSFINNGKSIHALSYTNHWLTGSERSYEGVFTRCTFSINNSYLGNVTFYKHADLTSVNGLRFYGCNFSVAAGAPGVSTYNLGIAAYDAGFTAAATGTNNAYKCTFTGHYAGVYASRGTRTYTFSVKNSVFTNNAIGIYVNGVTNESVLFNQFYLGPNYGDNCADGSTSYGIYLDNSSGFLIEENIFQKATGAPSGSYMGIAANNCPSEQDIIYKNTFTGLSVGNYAYGINRSDAGDDGTGLSYRCNLNTSNAVDFRVTGPGEEFPKNAKIHGQMGASSYASGNTFSMNAGNEWHFRNEGSECINYNYYTGFANQKPTKIFVIDPEPLHQDWYFKLISAPQNTCPSHYTNGGGTGDDDLLVLDPAEKETVAADYALADNNYNDVKGLYDYLKDGGNTEATQLDIETAQPNQMWQLVADLLAKSPYLSEEVLRTAADQTQVIPESELFEVLAANPDELRNSSLMDYLEQKENPLPSYMIDLLKQVAQGSSAKTVMIEQMNEFHAQRVDAVQKLLRSALNDTVVDKTCVRYWLSKLNSPVADGQIALAFLEEGKTDSAYLILDAIPGKYELQGDALTDFNEFAEMFTFQVQLEQAGRTIFDLDSTELALLDYYANSSQSGAGSMARGILEYTSNGHFCHCPSSQATWFKQSRPVGATIADRGIKVTVNPNPADTWAAFDYELPLGMAKATLTLSDAQGKLIQTIDLGQNKGQWIWDTRMAGSGAYYYRLQAGGLQVTGKLVVK